MSPELPRGIRGGSWNSSQPWFLRSSEIRSADPRLPSSLYGFRVASAALPAAVVPEPGSYVAGLLLAGIVGIARLRRRRSPSGLMNSVKKSLTASLALAATLLTAGHLQGGMIIGAASVSADVPDLNGSFPIVNLINQSGLSQTYVSGATDFDAFVNSATLVGDTAAIRGGGWLSQTRPQGTTFNIDFDLGTTTTVTRMALWNAASPRSLADFQLLASADSSFSSPTFLGWFRADTQRLGSLAQVFDTTDVTTRYLRVSGTNGSRFQSGLNIGEIAFETSSAATVPEPATIVLLGMGGLGMGFVARRKKKSER